MRYTMLLKKEAEAFDRQARERIAYGFEPDLRRTKKLNKFYNNVWRDPKFVKIHWLPKIKFVLDITTKKGGRVLEMGCGTGYLSLEMARHNMDVTGIDISSYSIKIANVYKERNKNHKGFGKLKYICGDFTKIKVNKGYYDNIVFFNSLHHITHLRRFVKRAYGMLKPGGNLIICEPIRGNFSRKSAEFAAVLRLILPTWERYKEKINRKWDDKNWKRYVDSIFKEYTYGSQHSQSPLDNSTCTEKKLLESMKGLFVMKTVVCDSAFIDKTIGGLRGPDRYSLARFLKFLDNYMVKKSILPGTYFQIHGIKKAGVK